MKDKVITALKWVGIVILCAVLFEALRFFMWMCYYAGTPM